MHGIHGLTGQENTTWGSVGMDKTLVPWTSRWTSSRSAQMFITINVLTLVQNSSVDRHSFILSVGIALITTTLCTSVKSHSLELQLSRTCTSVHDRPPRVKEAQGIALTSPVRPSEGTGQIRPPRTTRTKTLDKHLPIQDKPGWKPDTRSHSQVTHVIWLLINYLMSGASQGLTPLDIIIRNLLAHSILQHPWVEVQPALKYAQTMYLSI